MRVIVTCGPSWEPIDRVRRLTNFSTGELGVMLAGRLAGEGHEVVCMKGDGATTARRLSGAEVVRFSTNEDLLEKLEGRALWADAVFHAAALCDFRLKTPGEGKIPTRAGDVSLVLEAAPKILPRLRALFPNAWLVGWKYEVDGVRADVLEKARRQLAECASSLCVMNGDAWGEGFGLLSADGELSEVRDKWSLCEWLVQRLVG